MAVIRTARGEAALRSGRYATPSITTPMSVQMIMDSRIAKIGFNPMPLTAT